MNTNPEINYKLAAKHYVLDVEHYLNVMSTIKLLLKLNPSDQNIQEVIRMTSEELDKYGEVMIDLEDACILSEGAGFGQDIPFKPYSENRFLIFNEGDKNEQPETIKG